MGWKDARKAASLLGLFAEGLDLIDGLTKTKIDDNALDIVKAVRAVLDTLSAGAEGRISVEACELSLDKLRQGLLANDQAADIALRDRFDTSNGED